MERITRGVVDREDLYVLASHLVVGILATIAFHSIAELPIAVKIVLIIVYVAVAVFLYMWLKRSKREAHNRLLEQKLDAKEAEIRKWRRYWLLESEMRKTTGAFVKDRYKSNHWLAGKLNHLSRGTGFSGDEVAELVKEWDKDRRGHIKSALGSLSSTLVRDDFCRPDAAESEVEDSFKVSFYEVTQAREDGKLVEFLAPKWRYYPAEGEPGTKRFEKHDGASGQAWSTKRIVTCERGGDDPQFQTMWEGQKALYASMICVPVIEDIPEERMSEVYGVLTVDTPIREGYFEKEQEKYWADLVQPLSSVLIYCRESEKLKDALLLVVKKLQEQPSSASS